MAEFIAVYADRHGMHMVTREDDEIRTVMGREVVTGRLTRMPDWDDVDHDAYLLDERYAATEDGPEGESVVWIDGLAYRSEDSRQAVN